MRVSFNYMSQRYLFDLQKNLSSLSENGEKVTKGRSLLRPEDSPIKYSNAMSVQRLLDEAKQFKANAENSLTWITNEDNELQRAIDLVSQAKNHYAIAGMNDSQDATSRKALAHDVASLRESLISVGNAQYNGRYIFSGYKTDTQAFATNKREVSAVVSTMPDFDIYTRNSYADMKELKEGHYKAHLQFLGDTVTVSITDSKNNKVFIDSNGNDESATTGNLTTLDYTSKFIPGAVIHTGTGISIKLSEQNPGTNVDIDFYYKPGGAVKYQGDDGHISAQIGYTQNVDLNLTGKEVFMKTNRILQGTRYNSVNDLHITETTLFSQITGANSIISDGIEISGTDHNGLPVGIASVLSPDVAKLAMSDTEDADRTITLKYGERYYDIVADKQNYEDMDALIFNLNRKLEDEGLDAEIKAMADGDKIRFYTLKKGNGVSLEVTGSVNNALGFISQPISGQGKDTTFLFGYDNYTNIPVETSYTGLDSSNPVDFIINGKKLSIPANPADIQAEIDSKLKEAGIFFDVKATVSNIAGTNYDVKFELINTNYDNKTYLTTAYDDGSGNMHYQYANPRKTDFPIAEEKNVSDMLDFIENLYDNTVSAKLDNGKIMLTDLRAGKSRLSLVFNEQNSGIGFPGDETSGHFEGHYTGEDTSWKINVDSAANTITVVDGQTGITVSTVSFNPNTYEGEPIYLSQGVSLVLGKTTDQNIQIDLKANSNLNFGDMNITQDADNVDSFQSMKNLYDALMFNIDKQGVGAPSAWRDTELNSTANPYTSGEFSGNYNDIWTYETQYSGDKGTFYIQKAFKVSSGELDNISSGQHLNFQVTFNDKDDNQNTYSINANYTSWDDVVDDLKNQILPDYPQATIVLEDNKLMINSNAGTTEVTLNSLDDNTTNSLGILSSQDLIDLGFTPNSELASASDNVMYDLSDKTIAERTLNFTYNDGASLTSANIVIPPLNYNSDTDLKDAIQTELDNTFGANNIDVGILDNKLYFSVQNSTSTISELHISGDYEGTLGFFKKGDETSIKISSDNGDLINEIKVDTANKDYFINDGVYLGFDAGSLYATDSFTTTVGSGIEYEIPILDKAETQITKSLTKVGTNQQRAESVINFHQTFATTNEEIKSGYLMSTSYDQTRAMSEYTVAQQAYQAALNVTAQIMQMSLLDFLR